MTNYYPWPKAVTSFGYYPPECPVQIPLAIFARLVLENPTKAPPWTDDAIESGQDFVVMLPRTFYDLINDELPEWLKEEADNA